MRDCDLQIAANTVQLGPRNASVDQYLAIGTDSPEVSRSGRDGDVIRHPPRRRLRETALDAVDLAWAAGLLGPLAAGLEKSCQIEPVNEGRASAIDGREALLDPGADGVLVSISVEH